MLKKKRNRTKYTKNNSFLFTLKNILNDNNSRNIIYWNDKGSSIIIKDRYKLCEIILPKFFKHNNYSSFIRQLNLYGFHKNKGMSKEGDIYEHEIFKKGSKNEQIEQLMNYYKNNKMYSKLSESNIKRDIINNNNNESLSITDKEEDVLQYLLNKNEENKNNIIQLKKEILELKNQNKQLLEQIQIFNNSFNANNILLQKILNQKKNKETVVNLNNKKIRNLKELFQKYLYFLRIYSPYLTINNKFTNKYKIHKAESFSIKNINNINNNYNYLDGLSASNNYNNFYKDFQFLNDRQIINNYACKLLDQNCFNYFNSFYFNNKTSN